MLNAGMPNVKIRHVEHSSCSKPDMSGKIFSLVFFFLSFNGPSERNPVRTKASFDLMGHMFSFCWAFVTMGFRSSGTAICSVLPTDRNAIY